MSGDRDLKDAGEDGIVTMELLSEDSRDNNDGGDVDLNDCVEEKEFLTELWLLGYRSKEDFEFWELRSFCVDVLFLLLKNLFLDFDATGLEDS